MGRGLHPPLPGRRRAGGAAPARRRGGGRGVHQGVEARRHCRCLWTGAAEHVRGGAAVRPRIHPEPEDGSRTEADAEAYLARQIKFDSDIWIVEVEDRAGRSFLDTVVE
jgi:hypothetical protein